MWSTKVTVSSPTRYGDAVGGWIGGLVEVVVDTTFVVSGDAEEPEHAVAASAVTRNPTNALEQRRLRRPENAVETRRFIHSY